MKKILKLFLILIIIINTKNVIYANENNNNEDILKEQQQQLGITDFIRLSKEYTDNNLREIDIKEIFDSAIKGNVEDIHISKSFFNILGKEFRTTISSIRNCTYNSNNT